MTLNDKNVGDIVKIKENGTLTNYIVVQKGKPSDMYDESCDGVWLLREKAHSNQVWSYTKQNDYENSNIKKWLNNTFINTLDNKIRNIIKEVKIPYYKGKGNENYGVYSGENGLVCQVFLLSAKELVDGSSNVPIDGIKLEYFTNNSLICLDDSEKSVYWWTRSPYNPSDYIVWAGNKTGGIETTYPTSEYSARPAFIMPFETNLNSDDEIIADNIYYSPKPYLETASFDYNSNTLAPALKNFDEVTMTKSGTFSGVYAGEYEIIISLKDPENCAWEDGTTDDVVLKWTINPITVPKPTLVETSFEYEGKDYNKSVTINNYNADLMTKSGTETANKSGKYSVVFSLKDTESCTWDNGDGTTSVEDVVLEWEITKITVDIPCLSEDEFTYTGSYIAPLRYNENSKVMSVTGSGSAIDVGDYSLTYALYDTDSTIWSDGTIENKILYWKINQQVQTVKIPYLEPTDFEYDATRKAPTIVNYDSGRTIASGILSSVIACGDDPFVINVELKKVPNYLYKWEDNTTDDIVLTWRVNKAVLDIPTVDISEFDYDGTTKNAPVSSYNTSIVTRTGTISAVKAGEYSVIYSIRDKNSVEWADGTTDDKTVTWKINKSVFAIPTAENISFEVLPVTVAYNSSAYSQTLALENFDTNVMTVNGNSAAYPGIYTATITLRDVSSSSWEDGTTENKTIEWKITKKEYLVTKPSLVKDKFQFNGLTQSVSFNNLNDSIFIIRPETSGIKARKYNAVAELRDSSVYDFKWEDGTTDDVVMPWEIEKATFDKPILDNNSFDYDGLQKSVTVNGYNSNVMAYDSYSAFNATAARKYSVVVSLKDKFSSTWADGSTDDIILPWVINESTFEIPTVTNIEFTYNGGYQRPTISGFNSNVMTVSGNSAVNAGEYTIIFTLKDATSATWKDGTIEQKKFSWKINKAIAKINKPYLSNTEFTYNGLTFVYYATNSSYKTYRGYVNAYIRDFNSTYSSISGTTRTSSAGDYSIVITLKDTTNYIAQWSDGTTEPLELKWKVNKAVFDIPTLSSTHFNYGGKTDSYCGYRYARISGFDAWVMTSNAVTGYRSPNGSWNSTAATYYENSTFYTPSQWQIGKYYARFGFKDPASATWSDGTNGEVIIEWSISREVVLLKRPYLEATSFEYDGTEKQPVIANNVGEGIVFTGTFKATEVGNYSIVAKLYREFEPKDVYDYRWDDNTVDDIVVMNWKIWSDGVLAAPDVAPLEFTYDGKKHEPVIYGFDENTMTKSGDFSATAMGEYSITFSLKHPDSVTWSDGSTADKVFKWKINKGIAYPPYLSPDDLMYDGNAHKVTLKEDATGNSFVLYGFDSNTMVYSGDTSVIAAGDYSIMVALKDKASCTWSDGTTDNITLPFTVSKKIVLLDKPSLETDEFVFDGVTKTPEILMWKIPGMSKSGDLSATKAGDYKITISLIEDRNITYLWGDHSEESVELTWKILGRTSANGNALEKPKVTSLDFLYDRREHAPVISDYETNLIAIGGTIKSTDAGDYKITFSIKDKDSCTWADGTTDDYIVDWTIRKAELGKPVLKQGYFTYNGTVQEPVFDGFDESSMSKNGDVSATDSGDYSIKITPDKNHCWLDGTSDAVSYDWRIIKAKFSKPTISQDEFTYDGTVHKPVIDGFNNLVMVESKDTEKTAAGDYEIVISFIDTNSSEWDLGDDTSDSSPISFAWKINKAFLEIPTLDVTVFSYDGTEHSLDFEGFDLLTMIKSGTYSATAAGDYTAKISLIDNKSSEWVTKVKTTDISDKEYNWKIEKSVFNIPNVTELTFLYDGNPHAPTVTGLDENVMNISGNAPTTNAGEYSIIISLKDKTSATWSDGTTEDKKVDWAITKISHAKPYLTNTEFTYNGGIHAPAVKDLDVSCAYVSGEQSGISAGIYHVLIPLRDPVNNMWDDGSSEPLSLEWIIHGKPVAKPYLEKDVFEYDGKIKTPNILGFKSASMKKSGDLSAADIGEYKIAVALGDNYEWADGGFAPVELPWKITEVKVKIPVVTDIEFEYDGTVHEPKIEKLDTSMVIKSGISSATNAGTYTIKFALKDKTRAVWEDGTSDDIETEWVIKKRLLKKPVGETLHFIYNGGANRPVIDNPNKSVYVSSLYNPPKDLYKYEVYYYGNVQEINVGSYKVIYVIVDKTNYSWEDNTNDDITIGWSIGQKPIAKPYLDPDTFQYNGRYHRPNIIGFISDAMSYPEYNDRNTYSAYEIGEYSITINLWRRGVLKDVYGNYYETILRNYRWDDGDPSTSVTLKWKITKGELDYPNLLQDEFTYNGSSITPPLNNYISSSMNCIGNRSAINAGNYSIGFVLTDTKHYKWKDGIVNGTMLPWRINKAKLPKDSGLPTLVSDLTYNAFEQSPSWNYNTSKFVIADGNKGTTVGEYSTGFKPSSNYTWEDGTDIPIYLKWKILVRTLVTPKQLSVLYYNKETQEPNFGYQAQADFIRYSIKKSEDVSGINADEYYMKLECDRNCKWDSTGTTTCYVPWEIQKCIIYEPTGYNYKYTGEIINAEFNNYHLDALKITGQTKEREVGTYTAYFEIKDNSNYVWHKSVLYKLIDNKVSVKWYISDNSTSTVKKLAIPYQSNSLVYNGEKQEPIFANYNKDLMTLIGGIPSETDAGTYYVTFSLKDKTNYTWSDDTTEDKVIPWVIRPQPVPFPYILTAETEGGGMYYYELEGKRYPIWVNYNSDIMTISGDTYDIDNSWHTTYFELKDKKNYVWISHNDAYDKYPVSWKLSEAYVRKPAVSNGKKVHIPKQANRPIEDGTMKYPKWDSYDNTAIIKLGGEWEGVDAGERFVILELQPGYVWEDDTDEIKAVPWEIFKTGTGSADDGAKILLHIPEQINPPFYDGYVKYPEWDLWADYGFDVISGVLMEVPAGRYEITLRLKTGYIWEDGTTEDKTVYWIIQPRDINKDYPEDNPSGDDDPRKPEPETEETPEKNDGGCCNCCCDTGLFDKLNDSYQDDNYECSCQDNS